jgi:hypothetical protein
MTGPAVDHRRTLRGHPPRLRGWATAAGSLIVVLLVATSSSAGVVPAKTISAPYRGLASTSMDRGASGCSTSASVPVPWRFNFSTGTGSEFEKGGAVNACPHTYGGSHPFSQSSTNGGFVAAIDIGRPGLHTTQVIAKLGGKLTISTALSNGGSYACNKGLFSIVDNGTYEEWNYLGGGNYANWFTNYTASDNGVWHNGTTGNGVPPSPFVLNNTTYRSHVYSSELSGFCEAVVTSYYDAYALIYDRTTGTYTNATGTSWPVFGYVEESLDNELDYGFYSKNVWDGPSGTWTNASGPWTLNASGFLTVNYTAPQPMSSFWYNNSLGVPSAPNTYLNHTVFNLTGDTAWYNQSFAATDRYYLMVFFTLDQIAWTYDFGYNNNGWLHAYAKYSGDADTGGNGIRVVSIQER